MHSQFLDVVYRIVWADREILTFCICTYLGQEPFIQYLLFMQGIDSASLCSLCGPVHQIRLSYRPAIGYIGLGGIDSLNVQVFSLSNTPNDHDLREVERQRIVENRILSHLQSPQCYTYLQQVLYTCDDTEYIFLLEMKQGYCVCPLSWSVHCNFTGDGNCNESGWACTPHPYQPELILPS